MAPLPVLQEVELIHLSRDIPHNKYSELCQALGFSYNQNQSILQKNRNDNMRAMEEILNMWNTEQADKNESRSILVKKLHDVKLYEFEQKLSKGEYSPKQQDPHEQEATPLPRSSGIYSKKISESLTVQRCRDKLENMYRNQLCKIQMTPWNQTDHAEFENMHTVVTIEKKDGRGQHMEKNEILQGSVGEIFSTKVNGKLPVRILISAPAGRGKTTAVAKIAYDWVQRERGSALEHLPLLFVVKFRNTSQITTIGEAIKSQLLSDVDDLTPEGLERFIKENQGICHIILDGLDEYAGISSTQSSSLSNIVSVIRWKQFPECRVLVTTRPHLENFFNQDDLPRVYTKMWIEGFSRESSREYIDRFFHSTLSPDSGRGLKAYLDDQPLIDELVKTPLFCLMICHLWSEDLLDRNITTQTELLDNVNVFLMHHANTRSWPGVKITPKRLRKIISQLGEVALNGLLDDAKKLVFTPYDFRKVPAILDRACELGIVSKTTVYITCLPQSNETTSTTIEFYHKLAQEHSAGKFLASQTYHFLLRLKISKLDRVLRKIKANIGDYENLIRFAAGTDNKLCVRIMEVLLANSLLDESERYRILLDCSSETKGTEGNVSSLVQRCVTAQSIVLKSPTVYTVVGMQNLPKVLKLKVGTIAFEGSTLTTDVTNGLWSCLKAFPMLHTLTISDSSLTFPPSPPTLPSVTKLSAEKVTSQSYLDVLSSIPGVREIDVSIDVAETSNNFQITAASRPLRQTRAREEQFLVHIRLHALPALTTDRTIKAGETIGALSLLIENQTKDQQLLHVSGVKGRDEATLIDLLIKTYRLAYLNSGSGGGSLTKNNAVQNTRLEIEQCQLSTEMTTKIWSSLRCYTPLNQLTISDSSLSFGSSPPKLPSVTKLSAKKVTSQSYVGVLSSIPGVREIDVSIEDAKTNNTFQITTTSRPTRQTRASDEQFFVHIRLHARPALTTDRTIKSGKTIGGLSLLIEDQTNDQQRLHVSGVKGRDEEALVDLFVRTKQLTYLHSGNGGGSLNKRNAFKNTRLEIEQCQLSTEMTKKLWSSLQTYTPLNYLIISGSSLSFPPSPLELPCVKNLLAVRVKSQSYENLLSSLPGLEKIDITIGDETTDNISQIKTSLHRNLTGQDLTRINLHSFPPECNVSNMLRKRMRGLGFLIAECQATLSGVAFGPEGALIDDVQSSTRLMSSSLYVEQFFRALTLDKRAFNIDTLTIKDCQLSTEVIGKLWSSLRSFTSLTHLNISDSSLSFPPSSPQLPSVTKLSAERVTSQSYEGLLSSLPGLKKIDINIGDANTEDISQIQTIQTSLRRYITGHDFTLIKPLSFTPEVNISCMSRKRMRGLGLLITESQAILSGVVFGPKETVIDLVQSSTRLMSASLYVEEFSRPINCDQDPLHIEMLTIKDCHLSTDMTEKLWSFLRSFTSLNHLTISDSSLSFPRSPPKLRYVTKLSVERVTSQSYGGLLSSLPGLREMNMTIDDAERDIPQVITGSKIEITLTIKDCQLSIEMTVKLWSCLGSFTSLNHLTISDSSLSFPRSPPKLRYVTKLSVERVTSQSYVGLLSSLPGLREMNMTISDAERDIPQLTACLRRTGGQQLTTIILEAPSSLPSERKSVSRETMRGLGLIREQTKNLRCRYLTGVKCLDEEYLVELVEASACLEAYESLRLQTLDGGCFEYDRKSGVQVTKCRISTELTARMWSCLRSFTSLNHLTISDASLSFPPSPPELPSITKLSVGRMMSQSYEGLLSSLPGLREINISIDDAERDIPHITAGLRRTGGQQLTNINLKAPTSLPSEKKSASRETMRGLGLLIEEEAKNLQCLHLAGVESFDEESLVDLIECCRRVETVSDVWFYLCGTKTGGKLESHLKGLHTSPRGDLNVHVYHDDNVRNDRSYIITHTR